MAKLSIKRCENRWRKGVFYNTVAVNDCELHEWFVQYTEEARWLCEAFELYDNKETEIVWVCIGQIDVGVRSYVPLLVCSDDVDLSCTVLMAEQLAEDEQIIWQRFGWLQGDVEEQNPDDIEWINDIPPLIFSRDNFIETFSQLRTAVINGIIESASIPEKFIDLPNIEFPATKELWELEDFSYL